MKKPTPKFIGTPNNGVMSINNIVQWERYLHTLDGVKCEVTVKRYRKKRSLPQNAYFHGVVCKILGDSLGYTVEEMKSAIGLEFLLVQENDKPAYVRSTTDLNTEEFTQFLEVVKMWASKEFGVFIPDPENVSI